MLGSMIFPTITAEMLGIILKRSYDTIGKLFSAHIFFKTVWVFSIIPTQIPKKVRCICNSVSNKTSASKRNEEMKPYVDYREFLFCCTSHLGEALF